MSFENPSVASGNQIVPESTEEDLKIFDKLASSTEAKGADYELIVGGLKAAVEEWKQKPDREWVENKLKNIRREIFDDLVNNDKLDPQKIREFLELESDLIPKSFEYAKAVWDQDKKLNADAIIHLRFSEKRKVNRKMAGEKLLEELNEQLRNPLTQKIPLRKARLQGQIGKLKEEFSRI
ncbi:MAG TPA: hypothetical protein PLB38_00020 [bacterium]|nr:hypothetical protein [bacterium]